MTIIARNKALACVFGGGYNVCAPAGVISFEGQFNESIPSSTLLL